MTDYGWTEILKDIFYETFWKIDSSIGFELVRWEFLRRSNNAIHARMCGEKNQEKIWIMISL